MCVSVYTITSIWEEENNEQLHVDIEEMVKLQEQLPIPNDHLCVLQVHKHLPEAADMNIVIKSDKYQMKLFKVKAINFSNW